MGVALTQADCGRAANLSALGQLAEDRRVVADVRRLMPTLTVATTKLLPFRAACERCGAALARAWLPA
jgi:hypothetical protein